MKSVSAGGLVLASFLLDLPAAAGAGVGAGALLVFLPFFAILIFWVGLLFYVLCVNYE
jgi:hypothetical protein